MNPMSNPSPRRHAQGFSMLELVVVLVVLGVVMVALGRAIQTTSRTADADADNMGLQAAYEALIGFAAANARLPAADSGWAPRALGGARGNRLRYFVAASFTQPPAAVYNPSAQQAINSPGLNFCLSLARAADASLLPMGQGASTVRVLAVLDYGSAGSAPATVADVAVPGSAGAAARGVQGRTAIAISAPELFSALSCGERLARVAAAGKYADVAADLLLLARLNVQHWQNAIEAGDASNANRALATGRLDQWLWLLIADAANLTLMHIGKLPWSLPAAPAYLGVLAGYGSSIAQVILQGDLFRDEMRTWTDVDRHAALAALDGAKAQLSAYEAALTNARQEMARLAALGLAP